MEGLLACLGHRHAVRAEARISHPPQPLVPLGTVGGDTHQVGLLPAHHCRLDGIEQWTGAVEVPVQRQISVDAYTSNVKPSDLII